MASAKDIYEAKVYAAGIYAAGVFRGVGVDVEPSEPKYPGSGTLEHAGMRGTLELAGLRGTLERGRT